MVELPQKLGSECSVNTIVPALISEAEGAYSAPITLLDGVNTPPPGLAVQKPVVIAPVMVPLQTIFAFLHTVVFELTVITGSLTM